MAKSMALQFEPSDGHGGFPGLNLDHTTRLRICRTLSVLEDSPWAVTACRKGHHCAAAMWNTTREKFGEKMLLITFPALKFYVLRLRCSTNVNCMALEVAESIVWAVEGCTNAWRYGTISLQGVGYESDTTGMATRWPACLNVLDDGYDGIFY